MSEYLTSKVSKKYHLAGERTTQLYGYIFSPFCVSCKMFYFSLGSLGAKKYTEAEVLQDYLSFFSQGVSRLILRFRAIVNIDQGAFLLF